MQSEAVYQTLFWIGAVGVGVMGALSAGRTAGMEADTTPRTTAGRITDTTRTTEPILANTERIMERTTRNRVMLTKARPIPDTPPITLPQF